MLGIRFKKSGFAAYGQFLSLSLLAGGIFLAAALLSYHATDQSWFYYHSNFQPIANLCGVIGANIAALLFYLLGASSIYISFLVIYCSYVVFNSSWNVEWDRILASSIAIVVNASLCALYHVDFFYASLPGGVIGNGLYNYTLIWLGSFGAILALHMLFFVSIILVSRFSFISIAQSLVSLVRYMLKHNYFHRFYFFCVQLMAYAIAPFKWMAKSAYKLYQGTLLEDEDYHVADFESSLLQATRRKLPEATIASPPIVTMPQKLSVEVGVAQEIGIKEFEAAPEVVSIESDCARGSMDREKRLVTSPYALPHNSIFIAKEQKGADAKEAREFDALAKVLEEKLERFGVSGKVVSIKNGPVVTLFEYQPSIDTKLSKICALEDDLALALQALSIRIIAPIPGKSLVGFEVANKNRADVLFARMAKSKEYTSSKVNLPLILGSDTIGNNVVVDLAKMPHLLVAGSTGSGKSVALNAMLISLLCKLSPDQLKLILIDPKRLEFSSYADIAHLLFPIVSQPKGAAPVLRWVVKEMEDRYESMAKCGARNIFDYNALAGKHENVTKLLPFIVIVIDELADLMMVAGKDVEELIARITQMARASGIHMIVATQRPSVDVITGLIKVNFPSRISFRVTSKIDSRTILDCGGADKLLGRGDMLFLDAATSSLSRVHGAYVSDREISDVVNHIRAQQKVCYLDLVDEAQKGGNLDDQEPDDQLYQSILGFIQTADEISISLLQRKFRIGFNRSARIIEKLEVQGRILPADGTKTRKVVR